MNHLTEPRMPVRTRILRPALWIDAATATLPAESFRIYLGLATCTDDDSWTLWRPETLAAQLLRYQPAGRRGKLLATATSDLVAAGLLVLHPCGCAYLPYLRRDFRVAGGNHSSAVADFHSSHASPDEYVLGWTSPASDSVSISDSVSASSPRARSGSRPGTKQTSDGRTNQNDDDHWNGFDLRWTPVGEAMARRGFSLPPKGEADLAGTQRDRLWQMVRENPDLVARFIDDAPPEFRGGNRSFYDLVGYVFTTWNAAAKAHS